MQRIILTLLAAAILAVGFLAGRHDASSRETAPTKIILDMPDVAFCRRQAASLNARHSGSIAICIDADMEPY